MRTALVFLLGLAACGGKDAPRFRASCEPDADMKKLVCTIENRGGIRGRACLTARLQPDTGPLLHAPRACSGWIEAGKTATVIPQFKVDLDRKCGQIQPREWRCKVSLLEDDKMLGENLPALPE